VIDKADQANKPVHTGEEGEETVYQCRAKLYVMQSDGGWKERGVGALKLNVRSSDGKAPRIGTSLQGKGKGKIKLINSNESRRGSTSHAKRISICRDDSH
jgi:hypothetical protein